MGQKHAAQNRIEQRWQPTWLIRHGVGGSPQFECDEQISASSKHIAASPPRQPNSSGKQQRDNQDNRYAFTGVGHVAPYNPRHEQPGNNGSHPIKGYSPPRGHSTLPIVANLPAPSQYQQSPKGDPSRQQPLQA
jgi:hypothetical protein